MSSILKISKTIAVVLIPMLIGISSAIGQNQSTISGFVFDPARRPVAQIFVELSNDFSVIRRIRTDGSGRFFFSGLAHGRYTVKALPLGTNFDEQSVEVEIAGIGVRGQTVADNVQRDIFLRVRKTANSAPFQNAVVFVQDVPIEAETLYKNAVSDLDGNREEAGIAGLVKAISVFPDYFLALQRLGVVRLRESRFKEAVELFKRALAVNDRSFDCWYGVGLAHYSIREFEEAASASEKATSNKPDSFEAHLLLGRSRRMTKDLANAETALKQAAKISGGSSPDVHWDLALLYGKDMNRFEDAAKELELFLKAAPEAPNKEDIKKLIKLFRDKAKIRPPTSNQPQPRGVYFQETQRSARYTIRNLGAIQIQIIE